MKAKCSPHGWTVDTLETHLSAEIKALARLLGEHETRNRERFEQTRIAFDSALLSAEKATVKAETANEHRLESVNEFRKQLADQEKNLLPRNEYLAEHRGLVSRMEANEQAIAANRAGTEASHATPLMITSLIGTAISILMFAGLFLMFFIHTRGG